MLYREMGKTGKKVSVLGFGGMRLPLIDNKPGEIDEKRATEMVEAAIEGGINYFDTAYPYHEGASEPFFGRALSGNGLRDKVFLATKLPLWAVTCKEDMDKLLNEQLERLQTDHIDFYLMHSFKEDFHIAMKKLDYPEFLDRALADGRIRHAGFSFHDQLPLFKTLLEEYSWDFCQIQYNFMDTEYQAGLEGLNAAVDKGLGMVVMEPLRGGKLVNNLPDKVMDIWNKAPVKRSPVEWALKYIWDHPGVSTVLSGMSTMDQLSENIEISNRAESKSLTKEELAIIDEVKTFFHERMKINCTNCGYCMPCPAEVNIPEAFSYFNQAAMYEDSKTPGFFYKALIGEANRSDKCVQCGECLEKCPQHLEIPELLEEVTELFN